MPHISAKRPFVAEALVAGSFAAIRHAGAEASRERSAHIAGLILDGLRPRT
ncbi:hypothetical protein [Actinomadura sp. NPDC048394]|jgi:hypothetical protein|uniref:hypothetical protein n=1 Tax=Actinomadura sp. NPDC048394 TaxID=3158223 RepID=UPI003404E468